MILAKELLAMICKMLKNLRVNEKIIEPILLEKIKFHILSKHIRMLLKLKKIKK
jgi:hypothetical protein